MLSLLGGICLFYIIFEERLLIFYRNILKNCFKFNLLGSLEFAGQMCTVARCSLPGVFFFFFFNLCSLFFLPLPFPPSLAWPTDFSSHRFNPPPVPRPIPTWGTDIECPPSDDLGHSAQRWSLGHHCFHLGYCMVSWWWKLRAYFFLYKKQPGLLFLDPAGLLVRPDGLLCWQRL